MATRIRFRPVNTTPEQLIDTKEEWYYFQIKKESSGQVVIGESQELLPVNSGRGIAIMADVWTSMLLSPGTILYMASPTDETVAILEQILPIGQLLKLFGSLGAISPDSGPLKAIPAAGGGSQQGGLHRFPSAYDKRVR